MEVAMRSDGDINRDLEDELLWDPDIDAADIAVTVTSGTVELAGFVKSYAQKFEAEEAAKRVAGVVGLANDIEVRIPKLDQRPDPEIARDAVAAIHHQLPISADTIRVIVKDGWITLEGTVDWNLQKERAENAVRWLTGVTGVSSVIDLAPQATPTDVKRKIEGALRRRAAVDADAITVDVNGSQVILGGTAHSWAEREEAERAAWAAPGVTTVVDQIIIGA
jgi:osmotically-inducible protein OsmY